MKKFTKTVICVLVLFALLISMFTACGGSKGTETTKTSGTSAVPTSTELVNKTGLPIVNQPITYQIMVIRAPDDKSTSWTEKEAVKKAEAETGLKFEWLETEKSVFYEKIGIVLASGDLPDAFFGTDVTSYMDSYLPLNDLIETYAPTLLSIYEKYPEIRLLSTESNGNIYGMPYAQMGVENSTMKGMSINKKWLDKLNLKMPETNDELYEVLKAFKASDSNGNGKKDEIPLGFCQSGGMDSLTGIQHLLWNFGLVNDGNSDFSGQFMMVENGKLLFSPNDPRFYEFLKYANKLSKDGLIDSDGFVQTYANYTTKGAQGLYGVLLDWSADAWTVGSEAAKDYVPLLPMKLADGTRIIHPTKLKGLVFPTQFVLTKECKNPEALVRFWEYINSSEENRFLWFYGPENVVWKKGNEGKIELITDNFPEGIKNRSELNFTFGVSNVGISFFTEEDASKMKLDEYSTAVVVRDEAYKPYYRKEYIPLGKDTTEATKKRNEMFVEIDTYMQSFMAESILKGIDDAKWAAHLDKLKKLKIDEFVSDYQAYYDKSMSMINSK